MANQAQLLWHDLEWKKQVRKWIQAQAQRQGTLITGEIEQPHIYARSTRCTSPPHRANGSSKPPLEKHVYLLTD